MAKLRHIRRYRFDDEINEALKKLKRESEFVREAIREKLQREKLIQEPKPPF